MLTFEESVAFRPYTKVEKRCSFRVTNIPRFLPTAEANFVIFVATILTRGFELLISDFSVFFRCVGMVFDGLLIHWLWRVYSPCNGSI